MFCRSLRKAKPPEDDRLFRRFEASLRKFLKTEQLLYCCCLSFCGDTNIFSPLAFAQLVQEQLATLPAAAICSGDSSGSANHFEVDFSVRAERDSDLAAKVRLEPRSAPGT